MRITTRSGTVYEFKDGKCRRDPDPNVPFNPMRRDYEWLDFEFGYPPAVGSDLVLILQPLAEGADVTVRRTTPVVSIEEGD